LADSGGNRVDAVFHLFLATTTLATRLFFGTMAIRLMRNCPCPVAINQPHHSKFRRVLAAVDVLARRDTTQRSLNGPILDMAASLAESEQCELHLAYVIRDLHGSPLPPRGFSETLVDR